MTGVKRFTVSLLSCSLMLATAAMVWGDLLPGDVLDKASWENAQGLLPESVLNWVKRGDVVLHIDALNIEPLDFNPPVVLEAREANRGRYALDEKDGIIDEKTGNSADFIVGFPFPEIDPNEPKAAQKIMYNHEYIGHVLGNNKFRFYLTWVGRSGFEREVELQYQAAPLTGYPGAREIPNPEGIEKYSIIVVKRPYDLAGTAIMLWRFLAPDQADNTFGYIPAIRRVRRMSAANRSDTFVGSDQCVDDSNGYDGKVPAFSWRLVKKQEAILPFLDTDAFPLVEDPKGGWRTTKDMKRVIHGYDQKGWTGAPWAPINLVWVKRPTYVIEMIPKDRFYNYGKQYIWIDADTWYAHYKVIHDRSGKYWKSLYLVTLFVESGDKKMRAAGGSDQVVVDERTQHATVTETVSPRSIWTLFATLHMDDFSIAGFQKFCK